MDRNARAISVLLKQVCAANDRVLLLYPPGLEYIAAFFGCLYAGVIAVPAYPPRLNRPMPQLAAIAASAQATVALTTHSILSNLERRLTHTQDLPPMQWLVTENLAEGLEAEWQTPPVTADTVAFLQYTSGTTSAPKGAMVSHRNLLHNSALIYECFEHHPNSQGVIWLPPYHDMGLVGGILQPLYGGFPVVLMPPAAFLQKPVRWLQAISRYRGTSSAGPNFAYELCVRKVTPEQLSKLDLSSWEMVANGAEPIRAETMEQFIATFEPCGFRREVFCPCYGMAEATLLISVGQRQSPPVTLAVEAEALEQNQVRTDQPADTRTLVGCGPARFDQTIRIVDPQTLTPCAADQVGETWVSSPSVVQGYWQQPETTAQTFQLKLADDAEHEFMRTGDLGFIRDGELFITGRLKEMLIVLGRNHYPQDIEQTVQACHPALLAGSGAAFLVEMDGEERLVVAQEVKRTYQRNLNLSETVGDIRQAVAERHGLQLHTVVLLQEGSIPKTSSGKIQRRACRTGFLNQTLKRIDEGASNHGYAESQFQTVTAIEWPRQFSKPKRASRASDRG